MSSYEGGMIMLCRSCKGFIVMKRIGRHEWQCPVCHAIIWENVSNNKKRAVYTHAQELVVDYITISQPKGFIVSMR